MHSPLKVNKQFLLGLVFFPGHLRVGSQYKFKAGGYLVVGVVLLFLLNWFFIFFPVASNPDAADSLDGQVYSFECRLAGRQLSRGEPTVYERVSVSGTFRGPRRRREWAADRHFKGNPRNVWCVIFR